MTAMSRTNLLVGILIVVVAGLLGYLVYEQTRPKGVELKINENGISVQQN